MNINWIIYYNFIKPYQSLDGRTLAKTLGIINNNFENKWQSILLKSKP